MVEYLFSVEIRHWGIFFSLGGKEENPTVNCKNCECGKEKETANMWHKNAFENKQLDSDSRKRVKGDPAKLADVGQCANPVRVSQTLSRNGTTESCRVQALKNHSARSRLILWFVLCLE